MIRRLVLLACVLTLCITAASAFIRHTQAGLGCTPWPACERAATVRPPSVSSSSAAQPDGIFVARALHRVSAALVGLLALAVALFGWSRFGGADRAAAMLVLGITLSLSWLGRFTPHDLPLVTVGNVLGGFALAAAFGWIAAGRPAGHASGRAVPAVAGLAWAALGLVALQSAFGILIGARRAVGACEDLACLPVSMPALAVFDPGVVALAVGADAQALHLVHRLLGLAILACIGVALLRIRGARAAGPASGGAGAASGRTVAALVCVLVLAALGMATASGFAGVAGGTLHNLLAGTLCVLLAGLARTHARTDARTIGIDSH